MNQQHFQEQEYKARINRVIDYIQSNIGKQLTLVELASIAHFSSFHFHRLFRAIVGETLNTYIQRIRIEKAASLLSTNLKKTITEIAFDCGFQSSASFARLFKQVFGMSATQWRMNKIEKLSKVCKKESKICKTKRKYRKDLFSSSWYFDSITCDDGAGHTSLSTKQNISRRNIMSFEKNTTVTVKEIGAMSVAYIRHIGPYKGNTKLFQTLFKKIETWAQARGLMEQKELKRICLYYDDPEITDASKLRLDVCITIPSETKVDGDIGKMTIPAGKYAIAHVEISTEQFQDAWNYVYGEWLPKSGYQPDDRPCFEVELNDPATHPEHKHIIDIYAPVKPL